MTTTAAQLIAGRLTVSQLESLLAGDLVDAMRSVEMVRHAESTKDISGTTSIRLTTRSESPALPFGLVTIGFLVIGQDGVEFGEGGQPPVPDAEDMAEMQVVAEMVRDKLLRVGCDAASLRVGLDRIVIDFEVDTTAGSLTIVGDD